MFKNTFRYYCKNILICLFCISFGNDDNDGDDENVNIY